MLSLNIIRFVRERFFGKKMLQVQWNKIQENMCSYVCNENSVSTVSRCLWNKKKNAWCFQHDVWSSLMRAVFFWCVNNSWIFFCCCCQSIFGWCSFCLKQSNVDRKLFWALKEKNCRIDRIPSDLHKMRILLKCYTNAQNNYKPLRCAKDDENWNTEWTYCCILNGWKKNGSLLWEKNELSVNPEYGLHISLKLKACVFHT